MEAVRGPSLVIGGGSGVGKGVALALAEAGSPVTVADLDVAAARDTATETEPRMPVVEVDATSRTAVESLAAKLDGIGLQTVVSTVGVIDQVPIHDLDDSRWQWAWESNVLSAIHVVDAFRDLLSAAAPSTMVLTGSGSGLPAREGEPNLALYTTTKHALMGYVASVRPGLADKGVSLCLFAPQAVNGHLAETSARSRSVRFGETPDNRGTQPSDRELADPLDVGRLLVQGIDLGAEIVSNRPEPFSAALDGFATYWRQETSKLSPAPQDTESRHDA